MKKKMEFEAIFRRIRSLMLRLQHDLGMAVSEHGAMVEAYTIDRLRSQLENGVKRASKPAKARKPRRGTRHCGKCGSTKHDARNCSAKGKRAVLEVAKAA